jgi:hypothetical protein
LAKVCVEVSKILIINLLISSVNATRWVDNVEAHFKKSYPKDEYILLGNDQLVGVCLAIFIRRDHAPYVKYIRKKILSILLIILFHLIEMLWSIPLKQEWVEK